MVLGRELLPLPLPTPNIRNNQPLYCPEEGNGRGVVGNWAEWPRPLDIVGWRSIADHDTPMCAMIG